jgi:small subunit ribosomal protein S17
MVEAVKAGGNGKRRRGIVVSKSGAKTIVVEVERRVRHPRYGKVVRMLARFHAHDEKDVASVGSEVQIVECRPISKLKRWRLLSVVRVAARQEVEASGA